MSQEYFSDNQLAERYQVSRATIWRWHKIGLLPQVIQITTGTTRWRKSDIEARDAQVAQQSTQKAARATPKATRSRAARPATRTGRNGKTARV
jgi:predicted DNA-binding transcriptional regulator AlpA